MWLLAAGMVTGWLLAAGRRLQPRRRCQHVLLQLLQLRRRPWLSVPHCCPSRMRGRLAAFCCSV